MGHAGLGEPHTVGRDRTAIPCIGEPGRLAWGTTALGLASMMLLTDSADAQQSQDALPTIQVNPPRAKKQQARPRQQASAPTAQPAAPAEPTQTQATGPGTGYQAASPGVSRIATLLIDTPQTVNVFTQQLIRDQNISTLQDALRNVPGITFNAGEGGQQGDSPIIRGFVARGDIFRDGIRDPGWYTRDTFSADRVEVYKGPSAFAFGRGSTGGAINVVSKLPTYAPPFVEGIITGSTGPGVRTEIDAGGVQGNVAARIAALYQDVDTPTRDNVWTRRWGVAPSITAKTTDNTQVTLSYIYQGEEGAPDYGVTYLPQPAYSSVTGALINPGYFGNGAPVPPLPVPRTNWYGVPTGPLRDITEPEAHHGTFTVEHE